MLNKYIESQIRFSAELEHKLESKFNQTFWTGLAEITFQTETSGQNEEHRALSGSHFTHLTYLKHKIKSNKCNTMRMVVLKL